MPMTVSPGMSLARTFTVKNVRRRTALSSADDPVVGIVDIELDSAYENFAVLSFIEFLNQPPAAEHWAPFFPELREARVFPMWKPRHMERSCVCLPYKLRGGSGELVAITQMLAVENKTLVSSKVGWLGFPMANLFFVGFKPGMRDRTEELLMAGMDMVRQGVLS